MPKPRNNAGSASTIDALKILKGRFEHAVDSDPTAEEEASMSEPPALEPLAVDHSSVADAESSVMDPAVPEAPLVSKRVTVAPEMTGGPTQVPLDHIRVGGVNVRQDFDENRLAELQAAIETLGLLQPLVVAPEPGLPGYWHLIAGERRYRAICNLQWKTVSVHVLEIPSAQWRLVMMSENIQRENFTLAEELHGYILMIEEDHQSVAEIAAKVKISASYIYTMLRAYRNKRVREAIDEGLIPSRRMLMEISRVVTPDGVERVPGIVDRALRFLGQQHPTKSELHRTIETWLHSIPDLNDQPARRAKGGHAVWEVEQEHLQNVIARVMRRGRHEEILALTTVYQQAARDLEQAAELIRARKGAIAVIADSPDSASD